MRFSQRNLFLVFGIFSLVMLLFYWILGEILLKESIGNTTPLRHKTKKRDGHNSTLFDEDQVWQSFKRHYIRSSIISKMYNNNSMRTGVACASEVYLTTCGNPGLASLVLMALDHITLCNEIGGLPTVFWRKCYTVCPRNGSINAWELYFEPVNPKIEEKMEKVYCLGSYVSPFEVLQSKLNIRENGSKDHYTRIKGLLPLSFHHRDVDGFEGIITRNVKLFANSLIKEYVKVLPHIQKVVNKFYSKHMQGHHLLAVHIRGTDHSDETADGKLPPLITWIKNAKYHLNSMPAPKKIFVASDNVESISKFVSEFGDKVVFTSAYRAKSYNHGVSVHTSNYDPYKIGSEVLIDILLMAKCQHFLHGESSVAALVTYFNPDIHSHFLNYYTIQQAKNSNRRKSQPNTNNDQQEEKQMVDPSEIIEAFECFRENSAFSICNKEMMEGNFVDISE